MNATDPGFPEENALQDREVRLRLPLSLSGTVDHGDKFAASIRALLADELTGLEKAVRDGWIRLAAEAEKKSTKTNLGSDSIKGSEAYLALIITPSESLAFRWLRIGLLHWLSKGKFKYSPGLQKGATALQELLLSLPTGASKSVVEVATFFDERLRKDLDEDLQAESLVLAALKPGQLSAINFARSAFSVRPTAEPARRQTTSAIQQPEAKPPSAPPSTVLRKEAEDSPCVPARRTTQHFQGRKFRELPDLPADDLYEEPPSIRLPRHDEAEDADGNRDSGTQIDRKISALEDPAAYGPIYENWSADHNYSLHLAGALLPNTDRALSREELAAISDLLKAINESASAGDKKGICALVYLCSIVTGRPRQRILEGLAQLCMPKGEITERWISENSFCSEIPGHQSFGHQQKDSDDWHRRTTSKLVLPLSDWLTKALQRLPQSDTQIWRAPEEEWSTAFEAVKSSLKSVTPRFTEIRLRHVLPIAVWLAEESICKAQIITGELLDHSSAPLHYYAFEPKELTDTYCKALASWLPAQLQPRHDDAQNLNLPGCLIGAPYAALDERHLREAIGGFKLRHEAIARRRSKTAAYRLELFNLVSIATAAMLAAAVAHRLTKYLRLLTLSDFVFGISTAQCVTEPSNGDPNDKPSSINLAIIVDKETDNGLIYRAVAVPELLKSQIFSLINSAEALIDALAREDKPKTQRLRKSLTKICDGTGPLFQLADNSNDSGEQMAVSEWRLKTMARKDIRRRWPELAIPVEHLRHRHAQITRLAGIHPRDQFRQMGHALEFPAYGLTDLDSPLSFVARVSKPIQKALVADGWDVVGVPKTASDALSGLHVANASTSVGLHRSRINRARQKHFQFITRSRQRQHLSKTEISEKLLEVAKTRIETYGVKDSHASLENERVDADWFDELLPRLFETSDHLCQASRALRTMLRQQQKRTKRTYSVWPRLIFQKRVDLPTLTPGVTRAYSNALGILNWAEELLRVEKDQLISGQHPPSPILLLCVVELSIRAGIVNRDRLVSAVRGLEHCTHYGDRAEQVVIEVLSQGKSIASLSNINQTTEPLEAFVLSGGPAVLALAWRDAGFRCGAVTVTELESACEEVFRDNAQLRTLVGESDNGAAVLDRILAVAAVARRLTQPGLRSAWEDGRLVSRTLSLARSEMVRKNELAIPTEIPAFLTAQRTVRTLPTINNEDASVLRAIRLALYEAFKRPQNGMTNDDVSASIEKLLSERDASSGTAKVLVHFIKGRLASRTDEGPISVNTVYKNLTSILEPIVQRLNGLDLLTLNDEALGSLVVGSIQSKRSQNRLTTYRVIRLLLKSIESLGGTTLDSDAFEDLELQDIVVGPPYVFTQAEYRRAHDQLNHWAFLAERSQAGVFPYQSTEFIAAGHMLTCSYLFGMRVGETKSRKVNDWLVANGSTYFLIRPHRGLGLKTPFSARPIPVSLAAEQPVLEPLKKWIDRRSLEARTHVSGPLLFELPLSTDYDADRLADLARLALLTATPAGTSRLHGGRKAIACAVMTKICKRLPQFDGLPLPIWLQDVEHLEPTMQLYALSRFLGHITAKTTLTYYIHVLGFMADIDAGWPRLDVRKLSTLALNKSVAALNTAASRSGVSLRQGDTAEALRVLDYRVIRNHNPPEPVKALLDTVPTNRSAVDNRYSIEWLGDIVYKLILGYPREVVFSNSGVDPEYFQKIIEHILVLGEHYRYSLFDIDRTTGELTLLLRRRPRRRKVMKMLLNASDLRSAEPDTWNCFVSALLLQTKLDGTVIVDNRDHVQVARALFRITESQPVIEQDFSTNRVSINTRFFTQGAAGGFEVAPLQFLGLVVLTNHRLNP